MALGMSTIAEPRFLKIALDSFGSSTSDRSGRKAQWWPSDLRGIRHRGSKVQKGRRLLRLCDMKEPEWYWE